MVNQYKQQLDTVMQREISRGEFLKFIGVALFGLIGIAGVLKNLPEIVGKNHSTSGTYGRSSYGR